MTFRKILITLILVLFQASGAFSMTCNLDSCIDFALDHNPKLRLEKTKELGAEGEFDAQKAEQELQINWKGELGYLNGKPPSPYSVVSGRTEDTRKKITGVDGYYFNTGINLDLPLYKEGTWLGLYSPSMMSAKFRIEQAKYKYRVSEEEIRYQVTELYYNSLKIMEDVKLFELRDKEYEREYKAREARVQLGLIPQSDLFALESLWVAEKHDLFRFRQFLSVSKKEIAAVLGIDMNEEMIVMPPEDSIPARPPLDSLIAAASENHPNIKAVQSYISEVESELDLVRKENRPVLDFNISYSLGDDFAPPNHSYWTTSLNTSVTLFDSGLTKAKESSANSKLREAELMLLQMKREITFNITRLYQDILEVEDRIAYLEKDIVVARQTLTLAEARVNEHLSPESVVHEAEIILAEKEKLLTQARYDWRVAYSELWKEVGGAIVPARPKE
ncbi:MAG: TolC family protein [Nitrospira sp.]|nr:TolC family protein [Nitrospira sp.]